MGVDSEAGENENDSTVASAIELSLIFANKHSSPVTAVSQLGPHHILCCVGLRAMSFRWNGEDHMSIVSSHLSQSHLTRVQHEPLAQEQGLSHLHTLPMLLPEHL